MATRYFKAEFLHTGITEVRCSPTRVYVKASLWRYSPTSPNQVSFHMTPGALSPAGTIEVAACTEIDGREYRAVKASQRPAK